MSAFAVPIWVIADIGLERENDANDPMRTSRILLCCAAQRSVPAFGHLPAQGRPPANPAKQALVQLPHIRFRFRPAKILRFEMPGDRRASNTIR